MTDPGNGRTAFVLSGGGSRGSYQAGVWQAAEKAGIKFDIACGTSVGAINAAMVVLGGADRAVELWKTLHTDMIFDIYDDSSAFYGALKNLVREVDEFGERYPNRAGRLIGQMSEKIEETGLALGDAIEKRSGMDADDALIYIKRAILERGVGSSGLLEILRKYILPDEFFASDTDYGMITCTFPDLKGRYFYKDDIPRELLHEYIVAGASCFPAARYAVIGDTKYVDGGYHDNLPLKMAMFKGASRIIAVDLHEVGWTDKKLIERMKESHPDFTYIEPSWDIGNFLVFDPETAAKNVRFGYLDGMKAFGLLDGIKYTFEKGAFDEEDIRGADSAAELFDADKEMIYSRDAFTKFLAEAIGKENESDRETGEKDKAGTDIRNAAAAMRAGLSRKAALTYARAAAKRGSTLRMLDTKAADIMFGDEIKAAEFLVKYVPGAVIAEVKTDETGKL